MKRLSLFFVVYLFSFAMIVFALLTAPFSAYAQSTQNTKGTHIGVLTLQDNSLLEGELSLDFEQHTIKITQNLQTRLLSFSAVESLIMYDNQTHIRREFISLKYNELYEVVLAGELSLLRYYRANPHTITSNESEVTYFLYNSETENKVAFNNIATEMNKIFQENIGLVQNLIANKQYDLKNLQHIASIIRYHNQCKAKGIAKL
jgi:hypothetical protein